MDSATEVSAGAGGHPVPTRAITDAIVRRKLTRKTITFDNGTEFHGYRDIESKLKASCYFATPYHSWERERNLNGLIPRYLSKGSCFRHLTQADSNRIANALNTRPRKRFNYQTPEQAYAPSCRCCTCQFNLSTFTFGLVVYDISRLLMQAIGNRILGKKRSMAVKPENQRALAGLAHAGKRVVRPMELLFHAAFQ